MAAYPPNSAHQKCTAISWADDECWPYTLRDFAYYGDSGGTLVSDVLDQPLRTIRGDADEQAAGGLGVVEEFHAYRIGMALNLQAGSNITGIGRAGPGY